MDDVHMSKTMRVGAAETIRGFWSEHPATDYAIVATMLGGHLAVVLVTGAGDVLAWVESAQRQALYAAGAGVVAVIGGLSAIALSVYQGLSGGRSSAVKRLYADQLRRNWLAVITTTGMAAFLCLIAIAVDHEPTVATAPDDPFYARFIFEAALILSAVRFARLLWLYAKMLKIEAAELSDTTRAEPPRVAARWLKSADG